jgi:DNA-binding NarL/FixJ family response regulator
MIYRETPGTAKLTALTDRERLVCDLLRQGCENKEIAAELGLTIAQASFSARVAMWKLGAANRTQLAVLWHSITMTRRAA